jgi:hypothetical protein
LRIEDEEPYPLIFQKQFPDRFFKQVCEGGLADGQYSKRAMAGQWPKPLPPWPLIPLGKAADS